MIIEESLIEKENLEESDSEESKPEQLSFEERFKTWDPDNVMRIKNPKARAYVLDKIFWENPKHHKSSEFYHRLEGFIKTSIRKYGNETQYYDEDLPVQVYNKIIEAIDKYYDPKKANIVTFLHSALFNEIKLRAYHVNKYKDGTFYNKFYTYENIIKSITRNLSTTDLILLDNYFDHLKSIKLNSESRVFLKNDLIKLAPKNNILFKAIIWELFQTNEGEEIGKFSRKYKFNNKQDLQSIQDRRSKIRRHYNIS